MNTGSANLLGEVDKLLQRQACFILGANRNADADTLQGLVRALLVRQDREEHWRVETCDRTFPSKL